MCQTLYISGVNNGEKNDLGRKTKGIGYALDARRVSTMSLPALVSLLNKKPFPFPLETLLRLQTMETSLTLFLSLGRHHEILTSQKGDGVKECSWGRKAGEFSRTLGS